MADLVTIGIPVYKRLEYLPHVLNIVASQDYPNIEILVSDNGLNGTAVPDIIKKHYHRPYTFRQNLSTVGMSAHFNQLIHAASGKYFIVLADDDEITPNYVSELVHLVERHPEASVAMAIQETIDEAGNLIRRSKDTIPEVLSGLDFIRTTWGTQEYGYQSLCTFLAETEKLRACRGFPDIWGATSDEDLLVIKLCLDNYIVFSTRCAFRKRFYESSAGYAMPIQDLARGIRDFLRVLDSDSMILEYAALHPVEWREARRYLVDMAWKTYYYRWTGLYEKRLTSAQWIRAAFGLPFIPAYYNAASRTLIGSFLSTLKTRLPAAYKIYRTVNPRRS